VNNDMQFLELSLPAPDVRESLDWYRGLGFAELLTNDIRQYHYAVVSDGSFCIGLHGTGMDGAGLTFVQPDLARSVRDRMEQGEEFEEANLGIDDFHEAAQRDPDGSRAILLEARTFSPSHSDEARPLTGPLHSLVLPCMRVTETLAYWQRYGFIAIESDDSAHAELHAPGLMVELHAGTRDLALRCIPGDYDAAIATLNADFELTMFSDGENKGVELRAPEGTRIQLIRTAH
jgi:catechol 2,3-dioxygenase-like lactoylglutathione lyase family enzyme